MLRTRLLPALVAAGALVWSVLAPGAAAAAHGASWAYGAAIVEDCFNLQAPLCQYAQGAGVQGVFEFGPGGVGGSAYLALEYLGNPAAGVQTAVLDIATWSTGPGSPGIGVVANVPDIYVTGTMRVNGGASQPIGLPFVGTNGDTGVPAVPGHYHVTTLPVATFGAFGGTPLPPGITIVLNVVAHP